MMAGDWIKLNADLLMRPDFAVLASSLSIDHGDALIALFKVAGWFERQGHYGKVSGTASMIDQVARIPGLDEAMLRAGWVEEVSGVLLMRTFASPNSTRKSLGRKVRREVLSAGACAACGSVDELVIDHIIPIAKGGSCEQSNLQALCAPCNRQKGAKMPNEWRAI